MSEARVLFRVDAGMGIGFGHMGRCLAVAKGLVARGVEVTVATRATAPEVLARIEDSGCALLPLATPPDEQMGLGSTWSALTQTADARLVNAAAPSSHWDTVFVDHYALDAVWEREVRASASKLVVIDDLANRRHEANLVVDHNWYGEGTARRYDQLVGEGTQLLLGPRFALIQSSFAIASRKRNLPRHPPQSVLVNFGGTDAGQQSSIALSALLEETDAHIDVVVGTSRSITATLRDLAKAERVTLHVNVPDMVSVLAGADLAVGASGTATWERMCMGVPALVTTVNEGQSGVTRSLHQAGLTRWLGTAGTVTKRDYVRAIRDFMSDPGPAPLKLVDGWGAARLGLIAVPDDQEGLCSRPAVGSDQSTFLTAGVPVSEQGPVAWRQRARIFDDLLPKGSLEILERGGVPVGARIRGEGITDAWLDPGVGTMMVEGEA